MVLDPDLGPLEMRVLGLLDPEAPCSVGEVRARLERGGYKAAYTTVMTVLLRLSEKGLVTRERDGQRYLYRPARAARRAKERIVERVHRALFRSDRLRPIAALVQDELTQAELSELRCLIDARLGAKARR